MSRVVTKIKSIAVEVNGGDEGRMSSEDRRHQLIRVAIALFSRKGFSGTTTKEIARIAGVTEAIIFRHFPTKDDLYAAILDEKANQLEFDEWLKEMREHAEGRDDEAVFRALVKKLVDFHRKDPDFMRLMLFSALENHSLAQKFHDRRGDSLHKFLRGYLQARQREGAFANLNVNATICACFAMPMHYSMVRQLFQFKHMEVSDKEAISTFTQLLLSGLCRDSASSKSILNPSRRKPE
jgi:TetR/AcrR family transcriptional regulator